MRDLPQYRFLIDGVQICVRSTLPDLLTELAELYPATEDPPEIRRNVSVEVREMRTTLRRRRYAVISNGRQVGEGLRHDEVFPFVEWAVNLGLIQGDATHVLLHAATLTRNGIGMILAGESGSGKSTLAAGLMTRGWNYLCDEFALIAPDTLCLHPFRKAICTKSGSFAAMQRLGLPFARRKDYIKRRKGRVGYVRPRAADHPESEIVAPVQYVIFPQYVEGASPLLEPMPRAEALMELAGCVFNRHAFEDQALPILSRVVHQAQCYRLTTGRLEDTCDLIEAELGASREKIVAPEPEGIVSPFLPESTREAVRKTMKDVAPLRAPERAGSGWSRRKLLKKGAKLAYTAPVVIALTSEKAFAAGSNPSGLS